MKPLLLITILILITIVLFIYNFYKSNEDTLIYIINLNQNKERYNKTSKLLFDFGFKNVKRYSAVNGKILTDSQLNGLVKYHAIQSIKNGTRKEHHELSYGAVGCYLSHINLWIKLKNSNAKNMIVFEDDLVPKFTLNKLNQLMNYIPNDWDIILFGGIYNSTNNINDNVCKINDQFYQTHAYMINKNKLDKLINLALPMEFQIDSWMSRLIKEGQINVYGFTESYKWAQNNEFDTDIQTIITN